MGYSMRYADLAILTKQNQ